MAETLAAGDAGRPRQVFLRRSSSSTYYALFHALAHCCANMLIGVPGRSTSKHAWLETYRTLDHGYARSQCLTPRMRAFPDGVSAFATVFVDMQAKRHRADYDPLAHFFKSECLSDAFEARQRISDFNAEPAKDRRAFASYVLHRGRRG